MRTITSMSPSDMAYLPLRIWPNIESLVAFAEAYQKGARPEGSSRVLDRAWDNGGTIEDARTYMNETGSRARRLSKIEHFLQSRSE